MLSSKSFFTKSGLSLLKVIKELARLGLLPLSKEDVGASWIVLLETGSLWPLFR